MEKIKKVITQNIGIVYSIVLISLFILIDNILSSYFDGAQWYIVTCIERFIFGIMALFIFIGLYSKGKWTNVINFNNFKNGLVAGSGLLLFIVFYIIYLIIGINGFINTTLRIVFSCLFFVQISTAFMEEIICRAFLLEGYFNKNNDTWKIRLIYALLSFAFFGLAHAISCDNLSFAIERFFMTGIMGFVYATIYLCSHNILVPILFHFIYDIFANTTIFVSEWSESKLFITLDNYFYLTFTCIMFIVSFIFLIKGKK